MNQTLKRYLISSATTFTTVFFIALGSQIAIAHITPDTIGWGIVLSLIMTAGRAAVKAVIESLAAMTADKS